MLTIDEVARHWRLKPAAVRKRITLGDLAAVRIGGRYRAEWPDVWSCEDGRLPGGARADQYKLPLLTKRDLAAAMRVSTRTVERWIADGLPTRNIGENTRLNRSEAARWIRQRYGIDVAHLLEACA